MKRTKVVMLVKTNAADNNNKFYEVSLYEDGNVVGRNGRVGTDGVLQKKGDIGEAGFDKLVAEKKKGGYKPVDIAIRDASTPAGTPSIRESIADIAKRDIAGNDPQLHGLMDRLAAINKFQLLQATGGAIDIVDGEVKTPVGVVTLNAVNEGKSKLTELQSFFNKGTLGSEYVATLEDYLTCVPQKIPHKRGWADSFFSDFTTFQRQYELLEQLENSINSFKPAPVDANAPADAPRRLFGYSMKLLQDSAQFAKIRKYYRDNINHGHACSHLDLKKVYVLTNDDKRGQYEATAKAIGNIMQLWHGTRAHNVLSILKGGLIIPTGAGGYTITGRMFGDGIYFSDQSSKALNYAYGYWGGGRQDNCFMLLADVAMGKSYTPPGPMNRLPAGYDSVFAKGRVSGVQNNEMIVPKLSQAHLTYLCEFDR